MSDFASQVSMFVDRTKADMEAVWRESVQRTVDVAQKPVAMGGNMPVDTGFLRASLVVTVGSPPSEAPYSPEAGRKYQFAAALVSLALAAARLGETIYASWTAGYAAHVEFGAKGRPGRAFARLAAQQWPQIVDDVVREIKARRAKR